MDSDKPTSHPTDIKIKTEPGTSVPVPLKSTHVEGGIPSTTRLTSFRIPRDLTLGANIKTEKSKKVYVPNLNVQRNKKKDDTVSVKNDSTTNKNHQSKGKRRDRKPRDKSSHNLIQSAGVFSEGAMETPDGRRRYSGVRNSSSSNYDDTKDSAAVLERPKLNLNRIINKTEEEEKLKAILKDDFIDDGLEPDLNNPPVLLPLNEQKILYKPPKLESVNEIDMCIDTKEGILENGTVTKDTKIKPCFPNGDIKEEESIPQIVENKNNSYILIQLPDCLPGLMSNDESNESQRKRSNSNPNNEQSTQKEYCTLNTLKGGLLGKIQILKSGKTRLCLGENKLIIEMGSRTSFRQDVVAAKIDVDKSNGDLINLGPINSTLICTPDWESMLANL